MCHRVNELTSSAWLHRRNPFRKWVGCTADELCSRGLIESHNLIEMAGRWVAILQRQADGTMEMNVDIVGDRLR